MSCVDSGGETGFVYPPPPKKSLRYIHDAGGGLLCQTWKQAFAEAALVSIPFPIEPHPLLPCLIPRFSQLVI